MSLIPTSPHGWILSFHRPLFVGCMALLTTTFVWGGAFEDLDWRYARSSIAYVLLPWSGIALMAVSLVADLLEKGRRLFSASYLIGVVAVVTGLVAPIFER